MKNLRRKKVISFILCLLMLTSLFQNVTYYPLAENVISETGVETATFSDAGITLLAEGDSDIRDLPNSEVTVVTYVNGVETDINDAGVLKNGDRIKVLLQWSISNLSSNPITSNTDLIYNLNATGIAIGNSSGNVLQANVPVGTYHIDENGVLHINLTDSALLSQSDINGGLSIDGIIDVSNMPEDEFGQVKVEIAGETITVQKTDPTGAPSIHKQRSGSVYSVDGKNYQDFKVTINVNGNADEMVFTDTLGDYLKFSGTTINVNGTDVTPAVNGQEIKYVLSDVKKGETYTITYTTEIENGAFSDDYGYWSSNQAYYNKAKVEDSNNKNAESSTFALQNKTWINKSNTVNADKSITWNIIVNSGDAIDISGAVITDNIPSGLEITGDVTITGGVDNTTHTISGAEFAASGYTFPEGSVGQYTISYKTIATDGTAGVADVQYTNTANIKDDDYNIDKSSDSTATIKSNWLEKTFTNVDLENRIITWQTTVTVPDSQTTAAPLTYYDVFGEGLTYVTDSIGVAYDRPENVTNAWDGSINNTAGGFNLSLGDVKGLTVITITYQTEFDPGDKTSFDFKNKAYINDGTDDSSTVESTYQYKNTDLDILQYKYPSGSDGTKSTWGIQIVNTNSQKIKDAIAAGERVLIYDKITFSNADGSALAWTAKPVLISDSIKAGGNVTNLISGTVEEDGTIVFDLTEYIKANPNTGYFEMSYTVDLDANTIANMLEKGITRIKEDNSADAVIEDADSNKTDIGSQDSNGSTYPELGELLTKSYSYTSNTAPYAKYSIEINPNGYDLIEDPAGTLSLVDVIGADLQLKLSSVAIVDRNGNALSGIVKNYDAATRTLTIDNIPDGTPFYLTYDVFVDVPYTPDTSFESTGADVSNACKLFANSTEISSKDVVITGNVQESSAWASSDYGSVIISKHSGLTLLGGAEFTLTAYKYDTDTDSFVVNPNYEEEYKDKGVTIGTVTTGAEGTKTVNLLFDTLYKIEETKAPLGYVKNEEAIYVLIKGQDYATIENAVTNFETANSVTINEYSSGSTMYVENEPGFSINVNKNDQNAAPVAGAEFTLYSENPDNPGIYDVVVSTEVSDENGKITFAPLDEGTYRLAETSVPEGYTSDYAGELITINQDNVTVTVDVLNTKQYGSCEITKKGSDGELLEGVEFGIYSDGSLISSAKTDEYGKVSFTDLELFKEYTVKEISSIYGYNLSDGPWTFTLTDTAAYTINAENEKQDGKISITKIDADDNTIKIAGVVFTLYDKNKQVISDEAGDPVKAVTNAQGIAEFTGLPYDTYYVRETEAPENYILDDTYHMLTVSSDTAVAKTITNQARELITPYFSFKFTKRDSSNAPLSGAIFKLYRADGVNETLTDDKLIGTAISRTDGMVYFLNVNNDSTEYPEQVYTLVETSAPYGYYCESNMYTFQISDIGIDSYGHADIYHLADADLDAKVEMLIMYGTAGNIVNHPISGEIKLVKTDKNGTPLAGAVYGAFIDEVQKAIGTSNDAGEIVFTGLKYDKTYTIKEITPPSGYKLSDKEFTVTIGETSAESGYTSVADGKFLYEIDAEDDRIELNISKKAISGVSELPGAKLELLDAGGTVIDSWTSDQTAHTVSSDKLKINGVYKLVETDAPAGYGYSDPVNFQINSDGSIKLLGGSDVNASVSGTTVTMRDRGISFKLAKVDPSGNRLSGAGLRIQIQSGSGDVLYVWNSESGNDLNISAAKAADYGISVPDTLGEYNEYIYHEVSAPQGYVKADDIPFYIDYYGNVYLKNEDGNYIAVPDNRIVMVDEIDTTDVIVSKVQTNGTLEIRGAKLVITDSLGASIAQWDTAYSAKVLDGSIFTIGETYTLTETEAPAGYAVAAPITFTINADGKVVIDGEAVPGNHIYMYDDSLDVKFSKEGSVSGEHLNGAEIEIYDEYNHLVVSYVSDGSVKQLGKYLKAGYTDTLGHEVLRKYTMREAKAPFGYEKAADISFALDRDGAVYILKDGAYEPLAGNEITMLDDSVYLKVGKQKEDGNLLPGAKLRIEDADGNVIYSWTTGDSTEELALSKLKPHTANQSNIYILREISAPYGYAVAEDIEFYVDENYKVYVSNGDTFTADADGILTMTDKRAEICISKVDLSNSKELDGAVLTITDENGNVVATWTSSADSPEKLDILDNFVQDKVYTLTEKTAPYGYEFAEDVQFKIDASGNVWIKKSGASDFVINTGKTVIMEDAPKYVSISKVDLDNGNPLSGAGLSVTDSDGNTVASWISTRDMYKIPVNVLTPDKEYTLVETMAPSGYELAENIVFKVDADGIVYIRDEDGGFIVADGGIIVMEDEPSEITTETTTETGTTGTDTSTDIDTDTDTNTNTDTNTAKTGDRAPIVIIIAIMLMSTFGFAIIGIRRRRN